MGILDQGCQCAACSEDTLKNYQVAKEKWDRGERIITLKSYHYSCADGCCDEYGTNVYVNGFDLNCAGDDIGAVVEGLMEFLGINNVIVDYEYDEED